MPSLDTIDRTNTVLKRARERSRLHRFGDGGWRAKLGNDFNGFDAEKEFQNHQLDDAASWLVEQTLYAVFAQGAYGCVLASK